MKKSIVFAGSFDRNNPAIGIQSFIYDDNMKLERMSRSGSLPSMSNMVIDGTLMIACSEGPDADEIAAYRILQSSALEELNILHTGCNLLAHLCIVPEHRFVIASSMGSAAILLISYDEKGNLKLEDKYTFTDKGSFEEGRSTNPRQKSSRIHSAFLMPDGRHIQVCNLGSDKIYTLKLNADERKFEFLPEFTVQCDGMSGPRHAAYSIDGRYAYFNTELDSRFYVFRINEDASMELLQKVSTLDPAGEQDSQTSISAVSSDGRFIFCGNRAQNNVVRFSIGPDGLLSDPRFYDCGGDMPRGVAFGPDEKCIICSNNKSGTLSVLDYDKTSGEITGCSKVMTDVHGAANIVWLTPDFAVKDYLPLPEEKLGANGEFQGFHMINMERVDDDSTFMTNLTQMSSIEGFEIIPESATYIGINISSRTRPEEIIAGFKSVAVFSDSYTFHEHAKPGEAEPPVGPRRNTPGNWLWYMDKETGKARVLMSLQCMNCVTALDRFRESTGGCGCCMNNGVNTSSVSPDNNGLLLYETDIELYYIPANADCENITYADFEKYTDKDAHAFAQNGGWIIWHAHDSIEGIQKQVGPCKFYKSGMYKYGPGDDDCYHLMMAAVRVKGKNCN